MKPSLLICPARRVSLITCEDRPRVCPGKLEPGERASRTMLRLMSYLLALSSTAALAPGPLLHHSVVRAQSASARSAVSMAGFGAAKPAGGKGKAGFGSKAKAPKKKELVAPKRQWDSYTRLTEAGTKPIKCFARDAAKDGDEWMLVGNLEKTILTPADSGTFDKPTEPPPPSGICILVCVVFTLCDYLTIKLSFPFLS